jgi:hypothetical protein
MAANEDTDSLHGREMDMSASHGGNETSHVSAYQTSPMSFSSGSMPASPKGRWRLQHSEITTDGSVH